MAECISPLATRPLLYSDTLRGETTFRDDLWAVSTEELNAQERENAALRKRVEELEAALNKIAYAKSGYLDHPRTDINWPQSASVPALVEIAIAALSKPEAK